MKIKEKYFAVFSAIIVVIGTFLPILRTPFYTVNFFSDKSTLWDGIIFILLAVLWILLYLKNKSKEMKIISIILSILSIFEFFINYFKILNVRKELATEFSKISFGQIVEKVADSISLSYGWIFIIVGALGIVCLSFKNIFIKENK